MAKTVVFQTGTLSWAWVMPFPLVVHCKPHRHCDVDQNINIQVTFTYFNSIHYNDVAYFFCSTSLSSTHKIELPAIKYYKGGCEIAWHISPYRIGTNYIEEILRACELCPLIIHCILEYHCPVMTDKIALLMSE